MTVIPFKTRPASTIDRLIAEHGLGPVLIAILARVFKRTRPPDPGVLSPKEPERPEGLDAHLARDIGIMPPMRHLPSTELRTLSGVFRT